MKTKRINAIFKWIIFMAAITICNVVYSLNLSEIEAKYSKLESFKAKILQTQTAPYLLKPLESMISMSFKDSLVTWDILSPIAQKIEITKAGMKIDGKEIKSPIGLNDNFAWIFDFFSGNFTGLRKIFDISFTEQKVVLLPKSVSKSVSNSKPGGMHIDIAFDKKAQVKLIHIIANDTATELEFLSFEPVFGTKNK